MTYVGSSCEIGQWNARTGVRTSVVSFPNYQNCAFGPYEGNLSLDGRRLAVYATRKRDGKDVAFAVDISTRTRYSDIVIRDVGFSSIDWISISPLGNLVVVNGGLSGGGAGDNTKIFDLQGSQVGPTWSERGQPSHYDLAQDIGGRQVAVGVSSGPPYEGMVIMRDLLTGYRTALNVGGYPSHTSARNIGLPGWAVVSHAGFFPGTWPPYSGEIFAVKLDGSLSIVRLGNIHNTGQDYDAETHAVPSPDGLRVMFASNWDSTTSRPVQTYVIDYRHLCAAN